MTKPNHEAFYEVCKQLERGDPLNLVMLGRIFGEDFWVLMVLYMNRLEPRDGQMIPVQFNHKVDK